MILPNIHVLSIFKIGCTKLWCSVHFTFSSVAQSFPTLCDPMGCSTPGFPVHHQLLELAQLKSIESVIPSNHLILCCPLLLLPLIFQASGCLPMSQLFASGGQSIGTSALASVLQMNILQHHSSKTSILQCSVFFMVQFSHPYMTTGKTIALTRWTFVSKVMSLLFNMLSRLVITYLPRNKRLLISWLQSPSAVILEPPQIKSVTVSTVSPSICHEVMGLDAMILVFWMLSFKPTFSLSSPSSTGS